ncbi:MAG: AAA family ATPase, partial [Vicinamibacteria bacterium]
MYERHFGFAEKPFNLTPDSRYLFLASKHQEAFANLAFGVRERSGFLLLTGEVGTGKTTLIRHFLSQVGPDVRTAVVLYPALSAGEMFHAILQDLEIPFHGGTLKDAIDTLANALIAAKARDLKVVVLIDEAQNLNPRVLEQVRLMSNLETERDKLLTLVLVGQPELRDLLDQPSLRQLSQRITSRSHLEPLSLDETRGYIKHRLVVAGGSGAEISDPAIRRVYEFSKGVPRVINVLCDRALVGAFGQGKKTVDEPLVDAAAA